MGRRIVSGAALLALMAALSACVCHGGMSPKAAAGSVCVPAPCVRYHDCSGCYHSEANTDVHRLKDCVPPGGCCGGCEAPAVKNCPEHACGH